ncbi:endonuclease/exonuclease/phosphatase family protein [Mucilaginibacter sp.]
MTIRKSGLSFFDKIILWLNFFVCATLLLSYLAPITNPSKYWIIAFFGLAYPILLVIGLLFAFYWLLRKSIWVLLPLIVIGIGWGVLNKNFGLRRATKPSMTRDSGTIRIMTYNVHNFKRYGSNNYTTTRNDILSIIKQQNPDLIGFQEFYTRNYGPYHMVNALKKLLKTKSYYLVGFDANQTDSIGMAIFSKYPIVSRGLIMLSADPTDENQCIYIDVKKGKNIFRMYSVHLESIHFESEDYIYLKGVSNGKTNMHSTKRLASKLKSAFIKRARQVFKIKESASACPYPYIISGDFNDTPSSFAVNQMSKGLKNAFCEKGSGFGKTYNGDFPNFQIDYIMVSPSLNVLDYDIIEKRLSDHYPVVSDLQLK